MELILNRLVKQDKIWLVDEKKEDGFSALHLACLNNYFDIAKCLIEQITHLNINVKNCNNQTPLHLAVERNNYDIIKLLMETNRCDLNAQDKDGETALHSLFRNFMLFKTKYAKEVLMVILATSFCEFFTKAIF